MFLPNENRLWLRELCQSTVVQIKNSFNVPKLARGFSSYSEEVRGLKCVSSSHILSHLSMLTNKMCTQTRFIQVCVSVCCWLLWMQVCRFEFSYPVCPNSWLPCKRHLYFQLVNHCPPSLTPYVSFLLCDVELPTNEEKGVKVWDQFLQTLLQGVQNY